MVDNQMLQSFSDCLDLQLFMQHQQEEKVKENQMFYKYLQNQLQILTSDLENDNIQKQIPKQNKNGIIMNKTPQSQQRLNRYLEMKSIIDINFKQNIQFYIKQRELIKLLKERLYFVNSMIANKRQVYEIDLESQETRILVRDYFELKEDNIECKNNNNNNNNNNNLSDNFYEQFSDQFDQSNKGGEEDQDKMDNWIRSFNDKVQNYNLIEVDFGFEDINQSEQSFVNSLQWIVSGMNGIQLSESNSSNQILEQNQLQNQKQDIFQSSFLQDIENDYQNKYSKENLEPFKQDNQNDSIKKNRTQGNKNQIYIEIESKEDIQENEAIVEEEQAAVEQDNKQGVKSKPQTPSKFKEKMSFENGGSRGVITRSASKKLTQISPEKQVKNQSQAQEKANIWNDSCNIQQMDNAIFISNSFEQENSPRKGNTILQKELLEIHSNSSSSLNNIQIEQSKEIQFQKILKKETLNENSQIPQKSVLNNKNESLQIKKNIQIIKQSDITTSSIKLNNVTTNNNSNINSQQQKSIISKVKKEFSQPIPRINSGQGSSISKTVNSDANNKNKLTQKQKQDQQMELEKEVIIISPLETNIMSSSGISSQRSPNNSCIIVKQNKIGKKIIKEDKNSPNPHIIRDTHKINSNGSTSSQQKQKIQKRKIVKS
ncbi:hypothetical protein ABPG74_017445 [Tetrahymena malaccensis]